MQEEYVKHSAVYINIVTLCNVCVGAWSMRWELMQPNTLFWWRQRSVSSRAAVARGVKAQQLTCLTT